MDYELERRRFMKQFWGKQHQRFGHTKMRLRVSRLLTLFVLLMSVVATTLAKEYPWLCRDQYHRYCKVLSSDKCYFAHNRKLCCDTCENNLIKYTGILKNPKCIYGDKEESCGTMKVEKCYNPYTRFKCCYTCHIARKPKPGCEFGDRDADYCQKVKPYQCYDKATQKKCCSTCARHHTGRADCEYGDERYYFVLGKNKRKRYSCRGVVGHFGLFWCDQSKAFKKHCCGSCHQERIRLYRRYNYGRR